MEGVSDGGRYPRWRVLVDGERVAVDPAVPCERCPTCRDGHRNLCPEVRFAGHGDQDGALAEFVAWPSALLHPLPDMLSDADGALLEPLGVAVHALDLGHVRVGAAVGVVGCGPIGLLLLQVARAAGATTVVAVDPLPHRREAARRLGADQVLSPGDAAEPVDVAFETAGTDDAVDAALEMARPGARVVLVGIPDDDRTTFSASVARRKGLTLVLVRRMKDVYPRAIALVQQGRVDLGPLVTGRYPLERVDEAFRAASSREGLKVVVEPAVDEVLG